MNDKSDFLDLDHIKICANRCIFCFIDQLPPNMRPSLYVKDEDWRLSSLYGNFITMTSISHEELEFLKKMKVSPLYISLHAWDSTIRKSMLANKRGGEIIKILGDLPESTEIHLQIVLCPGINDGDILEETIAQTWELGLKIRSIGVVPVGLTRYRERLHPLRPMNKEECESTIKTVEKWQKKAKKARNINWVYGADELYLQGGRKLPPYSSYDDFPQAENGIGLAALLIKDGEKVFGRAEKLLEKGDENLMEIGGESLAGKSGENGASGKLEIKEKNLKSENGGENAMKKPVFLLTGLSAEKILRPLIDRFNKLFLSDFRIVPVKNSFFGDLITVTGLLTGCDILKALESLGENTVLLPDIVLNEEGFFLDSLKMADISRKYPGIIGIMPSDIQSLYRFYRKEPNIPGLTLYQGGKRLGKRKYFDNQ